MTRTMIRPLFALALAIAMLAAVSNPGHAALSSADRSNAVAAPVAEQALAAVAPAPAPAPVATAAAPVAAAATPAQPVKTVAQKPKPRRVAASRFGYPCH